MTTLRTAAQQALEAMRRAVPTGKITLYEWDKALSDLDAALAQPSIPQRVVAEQAQDEGLWFRARTAAEAYLQQELRRLHAAVEEGK